MTSLRSALALLATLAAFVAAPAVAGVVVYTDLTTFNAATVLSTESFSASMLR